MIRELLTDPRCWAVVAVGVVASFLFTLQGLRVRDWRHPVVFALGAVVLAALAAGFALFRWGGCGTALLVSVLSWGLVPLATRLARR